MPPSPCSRAGSRLLHALATSFLCFSASIARSQAPGDVVAWGDNTYGQTTVPAGLANQARVCAGAGHTLSLGLDGVVVAWGRNNYGQATVPAGQGACTAIAAGAFHSLALRVDGTVSAWGRNNYNQATPPVDLVGVAQIAAGGYHNLALLSDGSVRAFGYDFYGQSSVPAGLGACIAIAAGNYHSVALRLDGTVQAWGQNTYGQCTVPAGLGPVRAIAAGRDHTLALLQDGGVVAWGRNQSGQATIPVGLPPGTALAGGYYHSAVIVQGGGVWAFGANDRGQCTLPSPLAPCVVVAAGEHHTVVVLGVDCNNNGLPDAEDITTGSSEDHDADAVPDECQTIVVPFCFGDGTGTACPCQAGAPGRGCPNNANPQGALLLGGGLARVTFDNLRLWTTGAPPNASALYFQGNAPQALGTLFGDGLRCAAGSVRRLGIVQSVAGASSWPPAGSGLSVSSQGGVPAAGATRHYQAWYRDPAPTFCTDSRFNLTNGASVTWLP